MDVVVRKGPAIFQLFSGKDQALLVRRDALFVLTNKSRENLNLLLDILDRVRAFDLQGDGLRVRRCD